MTHERDYIQAAAEAEQKLKTQATQIMHLEVIIAQLIDVAMTSNWDDSDDPDLAKTWKEALLAIDEDPADYRTKNA